MSGLFGFFTGQNAVLMAGVVAFTAFFLIGRVAHARQQLPKHPPASTDGKNLVVQLCDGETNLVVNGVDPNGRMTPEQAQAASNQLMSMWLSKKG